MPAISDGTNDVTDKISFFSGFARGWQFAIVFGVIKVAMIGAGSVVFSRNLTGDILSYPEFRDATFSYMDIDADRLEVGVESVPQGRPDAGGNPKIEGTRDRRQALRGADFVINMVQIGGFDSTLVDFEIPRKYGLHFTIADTTGPGGLFRALRTYPDADRPLPRHDGALPASALLLNYSNPMSMNMQTIARTSDVRAVGLCHSVQGTFDQLMRYIGEKPEDVAFICAGINHMAFYLKMEKNGVDLYPRLFEAMNDPDNIRHQRRAVRTDEAAGIFRHRKLASTTPSTTLISFRTGRRWCVDSTCRWMNICAAATRSSTNLSE